MEDEKTEKAETSKTIAPPQQIHVHVHQRWGWLQTLASAFFGAWAANDVTSLTLGVLQRKGREEAIGLLEKASHLKPAETALLSELRTAGDILHGWSLNGLSVSENTAKAANKILAAAGKSPMPSIGPWMRATSIAVGAALLVTLNQGHEVTSSVQR